MSKGVSIAVLIAAALGVLLVVGVVATPGTQEPALPEEREPRTLTYVSESGGLTFTYPTNYRLNERTEKYDNAPLKIIFLVDENIEVPEMSEGPTSISIIIAENPQRLSLEEWVRTKSISNFALSMSGVLTPTTVDGAPALSFEHSGLYEHDAVAAEYEGRIYLFSVGWIDREQQIRTDFKRLVESVQFI